MSRSYNRSIASWESRLEPSLKRMRELGAGGAADVPEMAKIDLGVREAAFPEGTQANNAYPAA